jgi:cobalt-zinc-cadmium efflux system protein
MFSLVLKIMMLISLSLKYRRVDIRMREDKESSKSTTYLEAALVITLCYFIVELVGGFTTNSLALLTDAWHMLNDVFALIFSIIAAWIAQRPETNKRTYGYYRTEILAAFLQGILLWVIVFIMFYEAVGRLQHPAEVLSFDMLVIAVFGLLANGLSAIILRRAGEESLNVKGAFLHVLVDGLGSVGAISAGLIMFFTGWFQADAIISMMIGILILYSSGKIVRESINVLLEGVPSNINLGDIEHRIIEVKGVKEVHDLHVWCITPTRMCILSCHVVVMERTDKKELMQQLIHILKEEFGVDHTTIQLEDEGYPKAEKEHSEIAK